jgi:hypothetical protein
MVNPTSGRLVERLAVSLLAGRLSWHATLLLLLCLGARGRCLLRLSGGLGLRTSLRGCLSLGAGLSRGLGLGLSLRTGLRCGLGLRLSLCARGGSGLLGLGCSLGLCTSLRCSLCLRLSLCARGSGLLCLGCGLGLCRALLSRRLRCSLLASLGSRLGGLGLPLAGCLELGRSPLGHLLALALLFTLALDALLGSDTRPLLCRLLLSRLNGSRRGRRGRRRLRRLGRNSATGRGRRRQIGGLGLSRCLGG